MIVAFGFPNPIGWAIDKVTGFVGGIATAGFEMIIGGLVAWVVDAVVWIVGGVFNFFLDATDPNVQADWVHHWQRPLRHHPQHRRQPPAAVRARRDHPGNHQRRRRRDAPANGPRTAGLDHRHGRPRHHHPSPHPAHRRPLRRGAQQLPGRHHPVRSRRRQPVRPERRDRHRVRRVRPRPGHGAGRSDPGDRARGSRCAHLHRRRPRPAGVRRSALASDPRSQPQAARPPCGAHPLQAGHSRCAVGGRSRRGRYRFWRRSHGAA